MVLEALQERETIQEIGKKYGIHPNHISTWKTQFLSRASEIFEKRKSSGDPEKEKSELFRRAGQLQMEVDFLKKVLEQIPGTIQGSYQDPGCKKG
jgi:transposase